LFALNHRQSLDSGSRDKGFSLLEMMTVITLILILATFSLPIYRTVVVRAQGERSPAISCRSGGPSFSF
jgi:prepilin-type N-terminal cleavage/methylation domain-containing protein